MLLKNKFAIGCLVQFYEIDIIEDYIKSVKYSLEKTENKDNVIVDICLNINEQLEITKTKIENLTTELENVGKGRGGKAATMNLMEEDEESRNKLWDIIQKEIDPPKKNGKVIGRKDNIIKINFNNDTDGSA